MLLQHKSYLLSAVPTFIRCFVLAILCMAGAAAFSQVSNTGGLEMSFLKPSVDIEENSFQFNSLSVVNKGPVAQTIMVKAEIPAFINLISALPSQPIVVEPGETYYLPFRFNVLLDSQYSATDKFKLIVEIPATNEKIEKEFAIAVRPFYRWRCGLQQPEVVVSENVNKYKLGFFVENLGNVTDEFDVSIESSSNISFVRKPEKIVLKAGEYRVVELEALVKFVTSDMNTSINLYLRNKTGERKLLLQKFNRIGSTFNQKVYARARFPISVELNAQNLATGAAFYTGVLSGSIDLPKDRRMSLYAVTDNYYKGYKTKAGMFVFNYYSRQNRISVGNQQDFRQFFIVGNGFDVQHTAKNKGMYRVSAIKSRLEEARLAAFSTEQSLAKNIFFLSESFVHLDKGRETNSYLSTGSLKWQYDRVTALTVSAGGGFESIRKAKYSFDTSLRGTMVGYDFETRRPEWAIKSKVNLFSKNIPGFNKGFTYHLHEVKKRFKGGSLSGFYEVNKKIYNQTYDSLVKLAFNVANKEGGIRGSLMSTLFSVNTTLSIYKQQQDSSNSAVANMLRFAINLNWMLTPDISLSFFSNVGRVNIPEWPHVKPYLTTTNFGGIQMNKFGVQFRWDYRPFSYFEMKQFGHVPDSFRYLQLTPYFEHNFKKWNLDYRFNVNYTNDKSIGSNFFLIGNQFTYTLADKGIELGVITQYSTADRKNSFINVKLRKSLAVPSYKVRESFNFDMVLFKDLNGNDILDATDELIPGAEVLVNSLLVTSDKEGVVHFRNVGEKNFDVDFSKIRNMRGWMAKAGHKQTVTIVGKERIVYIPFRESKSIRGSIKLIADEKSNRRMSLSNIRVTATDQKGVVYNTLTDNNNEFFFDLPAGIYQVMINHGVFDEEFRPAEISKQADLVNNTTLEIQFEVRQRKRQINIKHDDDDDDEEEEE